jgi:hypothetical protein
MDRWCWVICALLLGAAGCVDEGDDDSALADDDDDAVDESTWSSELRLAGGDHFVVRIGDGLEPDDVADPLVDLDGDAAGAVERAPEWIREDFAWALASVDGGAAEALAALVLDADEELVDEVAWTIAATAPELLTWMVEGGDADLLVENAEGVYATQGMLEYASLVEVEPGLTTLQLVGEEGTYELDPPDYYWYVVYPRAYLELPMRVDGWWWRTMFLEDDLHGESALDAVADATTVQEAAEALGYWIQSFMQFNYMDNLILPVDIYDTGYGSCGEYSILTTAAAKSVLIPTVSVSARADDHEWNELWDGRWIMWDNSMGEIGSNPNYPYIDWAEIFDDDTYNGAGVLGEVAHVFRFRGDEAIEPSDLYTEYVEVHVDVEDADGAPVEGVRIIATTAESGYWEATFGYTGLDGRATLRLGDDLGYGFELDHPELGDLGGESTAVVAAGGDTEFFEDYRFDGICDRGIEDAGAPPGGDRFLDVDLVLDRTVQRRTNYLTEGYELGQSFPAALDGGVVDLFLIRGEELEAYLDGDDVEAFAVALATDGESLEIPLDDGDWALVLDNRCWPISNRDIELSVAIR